MAKHLRTTHAMLVSETARRLGVTEQTVRDWADSGKLPTQRTANGTRIFQPADVERVRRERQDGQGDEAV